MLHCFFGLLSDFSEPPHELSPRTRRYDATAAWGRVSVRRRRQGPIADVIEASRLIPSSSDPHSGTLRPIALVVDLS